MLKREQMHSYQNNVVDHIINNSHCGPFLDMGMGKTVSTLTAFDVLAYQDLSISKALVVAPKRVAESVWKQECSKWEHLKHLKVSIVTGSEKQRKAALNEEADIYTIARDNVVWLCGQYGGNKLPFDMLIIDELSSFKSPKSLRFKALRMVQPHFSRIVGLTGTPAPNGLADLWSQIYLLDRGERLERYVTKYRQKYFNTIPIGATGVNKYTLRENSERAIYAKIEDICMSMKSEDYLDLKGANIIDVPVDLGSLLTTYKDFEKEKVLEFYEKERERHEDELGEPEQYVTAANAAALSNKLLQFANGAMYDEEREVHNIHKLKIDALCDLVEQANGRPVLVAWAFKHDRDRILKALKGYKVRQLDKDQDIVDWNNGKIEVLLMHPASGGHGLNLQDGGNTVVWFGLTWSLELYQQFNKRVDRQGQKSVVSLYRILAKGTIDEDVIRALGRKDKTQSALMDAVKLRIGKWIKQSQN